MAWIGSRAGHNNVASFRNVVWIPSSTFVVEIGVVGMRIDFIRGTVRHLLNRFGLPLQILHFALERSLQVARSAAEFGQCFPDCPPQFWKLFRPKQNEGDEEDNNHLLYAKR